MGELLTGFIRRGMGECKKGVEIALREARIIRLGVLFEWEAVIQQGSEHRFSSFWCSDS